MSDWVKIDEKWPQPNEMVLFLNMHGVRDNKKQPSYALGSVFAGRIVVNLRKVTHWTPLPKPPDNL